MICEQNMNEQMRGRKLPNRFLTSRLLCSKLKAVSFIWMSETAYFSLIVRDNRNLHYGFDCICHWKWH